MPVKQQSYDLTRNNLFSNFTLHTDYFKYSFFPYCVREWNKLNPDLRNSPSLSVFKKGLLVFIRPKVFSLYNIIDPSGLCHSREHKFRHNFLDTINPLCSCTLETESTGHYLLRCPFYADVRKTLLDNINITIGSILSLSTDKLIHLLLYGNEAYNVEVNAAILKSTIVFRKSSERFDMVLL